MFLLFLLVFFFELMCVKSFVSFSISFVLLTLIKKKKHLQSFQTKTVNVNY